MKKAVVTALAAVFLAGCASFYERSADREVAPILDGMTAKVDTERAAETPEGVIEPKPGGPEIRLGAPAREGEAEKILNLEESLGLAFSNSREFKRAKESLYLSALAFTMTRHNYSWRPSASVSGSASASGNGPDETVETAEADATFALARRLLSGGSFSVSASAQQTRTIDGPGSDGDSSSVRASFSQPLLRGAGTAARESMVSATRGLLYDARDFELFRQDLAIGTINRYYGLLSKRRFIESARQRLDDATFLYEKTSAMFDKGKQKKVEVLRAEQDRLDAENGLSNSIEDYNLALDEFKIALGLPTDAAIDVAEESIEPDIVEVNLAEAVKTAFANRLDLLSARQQLEDVERGVEIARNALLPELEFVASASASSESGGTWLDYSADNGSASVGLSLQLPVDKKGERNAYKSALIGLAQARRGFSLTEDRITLDVRSSVRNLRQAEVRLVIQQKQVELATDRLEVARIDLERGATSSRDVVEAQTALQQAQNGLVQAKVDYLIETISLRKNIGTLRVDERGMWQ
jgi:outer membrane protein TolC